MKVCLHCGSMISPHPIHKTESGYCATCARELGFSCPDDPVTDGGRPRMRGRHMVIKKTPAEIEIERRRKERGHIARY